MPPLNLHKTQSGYVPLEDRFKSFPKDSENTPGSDVDFYYMNYANSTLEHATIDLLFPTPDWLRLKLQRQRNTKTFAAYRVTGTGQLRVTTDGKYRIAMEVKNGS